MTQDATQKRLSLIRCMAAVALLASAAACSSGTVNNPRTGMDKFPIAGPYAPYVVTSPPVGAQRLDGQSNFVFDSAPSAPPPRATADPIPTVASSVSTASVSSVGDATRAQAQRALASSGTQEGYDVDVGGVAMTMRLSDVDGIQFATFQHRSASPTGGQRDDLTLEAERAAAAATGCDSVGRSFRAQSSARGPVHYAVALTC